jgi:2-polyprenyl-3-methyl-5-hydroxy-6-metoxy-1,4-benzoquinol methylase
MSLVSRIEDVLLTCRQRKIASDTRPLARKRRNETARSIMDSGLLVDRKRCPVCGSLPNESDAILAPLYRFVRCSACSAMYADRIPDRNTLRRLYTSSEEEAAWSAVTLADASARTADWHFLSWLEVNDWPIRGKRLLDAGCGAGQTLLAARGKGMEPSGIEINPVASQAVRDMGFEVHEVEIESFHLLSQTQYDVIVLNQVLEHLAEPSTVLSNLTSRLKPGGRLLFSSPHSDGLSMRRFRDKHVHIFSFHHLQLFSVRSLEALADNAGLSLVHGGTDGFLDICWDDLICVNLGYGAHRASYLPFLSVPFELALRLQRRAHLSQFRLMEKGLGSYIVGVFEKPESRPLTIGQGCSV